jgi:aspartyl-tRNA(Asn)/glutamyl-tRNA(Gln) amidotransferase subunit B
MDHNVTTVIGLEVHVQLATASKMFCRCSTRFGAPPNTQTCPVCIGMPGSLPVMNRHAFQLSLKTAVALHCTIPPQTKWDRKQYYYPDLPKNYQISQYDLPMSEHGYLEIRDPKGRFAAKRIRITRAHLEEDAGKSMHDESAGTADSCIDLNRTGTPLLEIVSEPDIRSPLEAHTYLTELKLLLGYLDVSDCNMQEGSLRVDANVNLHIDTEQGQVATPIVEVKNMNSFRAVERALAHEVERQWQRWQETGETLGDVPKQTRGWDDAEGVTRAQRHKEESSDYRYFPDPDLVPVTVTEAEVDQVRKGLGQLPSDLRQSLQDDHGISAYDSDVLVHQGRRLVDYFVEVATACGDGKVASNWIQQDVLRRLNANAATIDHFPIAAADLGNLIARVRAGQLDTSRGRDVLAAMLANGQSAAEAIAALRIEAVDDTALTQLCRELIAANPKVVADIRAGKMKAAGALIGQAKKKNPNANPGRVRALCIELINREERE